MKTSFQNVILLVYISDGNCVSVKNQIIDLYKNHFKKIFIYSDSPTKQINEDLTDVHLVPTNRAIFVHKIFDHFYSNYKADILNSDGVLYTMDDNIINLNILNLFDVQKIIHYKQNLLSPNDYDKLRTKEQKELNNHWNHWNPRVKIAMQQLCEDKTLKGIAAKPYDRHCSGLGDCFYLPIKYFNDKFISLCNKLSHIHMEVAIPTIINNLEQDINSYAHLSESCFLGQYNYFNRGKYNDSDYVGKAVNKNLHLFMHPIKLKAHPESFTALKNSFSKNKCVIITTINEPTKTILDHINNPEYDVIIVGDKKTPDTYKDEDCIFLDVATQKRLFPDLCDLIPYNHYGRKNLGYLFAVRKGYDIIYETDDDNIPYDKFDDVLDFSDQPQTIKDPNFTWINIFKYFTNNNWIWPRGYPLSNIKKNQLPNFTFDNSKNKEDVAIINGLVENDPDVDAIFRLVCNHSVNWEKNKKIIISNENTCPFNTQNTFWIDPDLFIGLLIPCSVTFRYCDILKGIVANTLLKHNNKNMAYTSPNVTQLRNEHDLMQDFESESPMYLTNETIVDKLSKDVLPEQKCLYLIQASGELPKVYEHFKNKKDFVLLSYKNKTQDTDIFLPNSTWTSGRNALRDYALRLDQDYDYYIFLDEDLVFDDGKTFDDFELSLNKYRPNIGSPTVGGYGHEYFNPRTDAIMKLNNRSVLFFDGCCNAFSRKAFLSNQIFPYITEFDNTNWWASQYIMIMLCRESKNDVYVFNELAVTNTQASSYPKAGNFQNVKEYLKKQNVANDELKFTNSTCKKIDSNFNQELMSNIYQKLYDTKIISELDLKICEAWIKNI